MTEPQDSPWRAEKRFAEVLGSRMAYIERGHGRPIVLLHGNPTSSYLWRGVLPALEPFGRLIAPDLMGMGDSDKLGPEVADRYRLATHLRYFDAFMKKVQADEDVVLVLHDWGGAVGFDWAYRHQRALRGIAYMETFVRPLEWSDLPESFHPTLRAVRSVQGESMVLEQNMFIEQMLPSVTQRQLSASEMAEYRRPFEEPGDARMPTLVWPREVPLEGDPSDVAARIATYSKWLRTSQTPKLFIDAEPGLFITGEVRRLCKSFPNQTEACVNGLHFVQEDDPDAVGRVTANWLATVD